MSVHYSKHLLNTYNHTPYFQAHIPEDYPLEKVLQKSRAFRRLPPNLRELSEKSKQWAIHNLGPRIGIERWYDDEGYELDPGSGKRLTDKEVDESWPDLSALKKFKVTDIPIPSDGFADPHRWEEPPPEPEEEDEEADKPPDEDKLTADIGSHSREYVAKEYGIPLDFLKNISTDRELAQAIIDRRDGGVGVGLSLEEDISVALAQTANWRKNLPPGARYGKKSPGPGWTMTKGPRGGTIWIPPTPAKVSPAPVPAPATTPPVAPPVQTPPVAKPTPPPVTPPSTAPIPTREFPQRDPSHPVAKAIREDAESRRIVTKMHQYIDAIKSDPEYVGALKDIEDEKRLTAEVRSIENKHGVHSQKSREARIKWAEAYTKKAAAEKILDKHQMIARKKFVELMKPQNPPKIGKKYHEGIADYQKKGEWIVEPFRPTPDQEEAIDKSIEFVRSITEGSGLNHDITFGKSRDGRAGFKHFRDKVPSKNILARWLGLGGTEVVDARIQVGIVLDQKHAVTTNVHELGHYIDHLKPGVEKKVQEFLNYRVGDEKLVDMATVPGGSNQPGEMVRKDNFDRHFPIKDAYYAGREYKDPKTGKVDGTEIVSMGIQALYEDPAGFVANDPEYASFVIGILRM